MELRLLRYFLTVADERQIRRAALRLHMAQPPLSRAMQQLENELGVRLFRRSGSGVELTEAGRALEREARSLLERVDQLSSRVRHAGRPNVTVGTGADTVDQLGTSLIIAFRHRHPEVLVRLKEFDLTDPTAGLRSGKVDVALTRGPFDVTGIATRALRRDPVGVVVSDRDALAGREEVSLSELRERTWVRLPADVDAAWRSYWSVETANTGDSERPVVRTIQESLQSVAWSGASTFAPLCQVLPPGLVNVPVPEKEPSVVLVAWDPDNVTPPIDWFVQAAVEHALE